jgi:hypothetical protein
MQGDYFRYLSEYAQANAYDEASKSAEISYNEAAELAKESLHTTNPIRLGLALNCSVFFYEVKNMQLKACSVIKEAFDACVKDIRKVEDGHLDDMKTIMKSMRDNLTLWESEIEIQKE